MNRLQSWLLVAFAIPFPLLVGFCIGAILGMRFDSDRVIFLDRVMRQLDRLEQEQKGLN